LRIPSLACALAICSAGSALAQLPGTPAAPAQVETPEIFNRERLTFLT
jgi:hypothetical protein